MRISKSILAAVAMLAWAGTANAVTRTFAEATVGLSGSPGYDGGYLEEWRLFISSKDPNSTNFASARASGTVWCCNDAPPFLDVHLEGFKVSIAEPLAMLIVEWYRSDSYYVGNGGGGAFTFDLRVYEIIETPLPAAMPLFAGGLGVIGWLALRGRRRCFRPEA